MDRILENSVPSEIIPCGFDTPCLLFPVRHHSPVCSYQLKKTIKEYRPDIILIEGPENANELIPILTDEETKLPAAFYYFYKDTKKLVSDEGDDYKCYYPFLLSSPEYNAAAEAKKLGIPSQFIDLPYCEILIGTAEGQGLRKESEKHSYTDDSGFMRSRFYKKICEKTGLRDFDEFWEKYFEIKGLRLTPQEFIRQMHTYCILSRQDVSAKELEADGTAVRERHMAVRIAEAAEKYGKVLVVTGGFHSIGIYRLLQEKNLSEPRLHSIPPTEQGCYPMAYSYEAADALHGYASGMSYPYFYDSIMKKLNETDSPENIYNEQTIDFLIKTSKESSKKDIAVSTADVYSALSLMQGLAALRNSPECGMFELIDGVTSTFIKGEKTLSSSIPLDLLAGIATGSSIGKIGDKSHIPPLIADFEKQCEKLGIKYSSAVPKDIEIPLFTSQKGMEQSRFLHRTAFLRTNFAKRKKGPDLHNNRDRSRVREEWRYRRTPTVDSTLIDHTTYGFTIEEACSAYAAKLMHSERRTENAAQIAVDCFLMGIPLQPSEYELLDDILNGDGDFFSIGNALHSFEILYSLQQLYSFEDASSLNYISRCFDKLVSALPSMASTPPERADECTNIMRQMYAAASETLPEKFEAFEQALLTLTETPEKEASVFGSAMGILCAISPERRSDAENAMMGYLKGTSEIKKQGAEYLKGLFGSSRDIVLADDSFMKMADTLITDMDYDDFMEILPSMKLAFSYFTPNEIQSLAKTAADIHNSDKNSILNIKAFDEKLFAFGEKIDSEICRLIGKEELLS
mgnify:CR=1 FL=1